MTVLAERMVPCVICAERCTPHQSSRQLGFATVCAVCCEPLLPAAPKPSEDDTRRHRHNVQTARHRIRQATP